MRPNTLTLTQQPFNLLFSASCLFHLTSPPLLANLLVFIVGFWWNQKDLQIGLPIPFFFLLLSLLVVGKPSSFVSALSMKK